MNAYGDYTDCMINQLFKELPVDISKVEDYEWNSSLILEPEQHEFENKTAAMTRRVALVNEKIRPSDTRFIICMMATGKYQCYSSFVVYPSAWKIAVKYVTRVEHIERVYNNCCIDDLNHFTDALIEAGKEDLLKEHHKKMIASNEYGPSDIKYIVKTARPEDIAVDDLGILELALQGYVTIPDTRLFELYSRNINMYVMPTGRIDLVPNAGLMYYISKTPIVNIERTIMRHLNASMKYKMTCRALLRRIIKDCSGHQSNVVSDITNWMLDSLIRWDTLDIDLIKTTLKKMCTERGISYREWKDIMVESYGTRTGNPAMNLLFEYADAESNRDSDSDGSDLGHGFIEENPPDSDSE